MALLQLPLLLSIATCLAAASPLQSSPKSLIFALDKRDDPLSSTTTPLTFYSSHSQYYTTIYLGTPPQPVTIHVDTGSVTTWVPGPSCIDCNSAHHYTPSASSTSVDQHSTFSITYNEGAATGEYYSDFAEIGTMGFSDFVFGAATSVGTPEAAGDPVDGVMGLAFPSGVNLPFPWALKAAGLTDGVIFGVKFTTTGGELSLGSADTTLYTGSPNWTPVTSTTNRWEVQGSIIVNNVSAVTGVTALIDTGTTGIIGPTAAAVAAVHAHIPNATYNSSTGAWSVPCDTGSNKVSFQFSGVPHPANYAYLHRSGTTGSMCLSFISIATNSNAVNWIFGQRFLINQYNIFDADNLRVGFATLKTT